MAKRSIALVIVLLGMFGLIPVLAPSDAHPPARVNGPTQASVSAATSTSTSPASAFTPCDGYGDPPQGPEDGLGPWASRLMIAYSTDGLVWERANRVLSDQADVPDALIDDDGKLRVYYVTWCPEQVHNKIVVAVSPDGGEAWTYRQVTIDGLEPGHRPTTAHCSAPPTALSLPVCPRWACSFPTGVCSPARRR